MVWISRELTTLSRQKLLTDFSVFDIETVKWGPKDEDRELTDEDVLYWQGRDIEPFLLTHWDGTKARYFFGSNCVKDFVDEFIGQKKYRSPHIFFAHNGGKFDFLPVFHYLKSQKPQYRVTTMMQHARLMAVKIIDKNRNRWQMRDSFSLMQHSLKKLTKGFKVEHPKMTMPMVSWKGHEEEWAAYCLNDCKGLYEVLKTFSNVIKEVGGSVGYSTAGTAMPTWRLSYFGDPIVCYHDFNNLFRNAFYGGRTEIFHQYARLEDGPFYYYDVNSMYPAVMKEALYPVSYPRSVDLTRDPSEVVGRLGIMECDVTTPETLDIPLLPFHAEKKLLFPVGNWRGFYDFSEIEKALQLGYKIKPHRAWEFEGDHIFGRYIDTFYPMKQENKGNAKGEIAKLMLNSLFGKTGEHDEQEKLVEEGDYLGLSPVDLIYGYATCKEIRRSPYHLPAIALRVTTLARLKLYSIFERIQAEEGRVYYCDTDSVITNVRLPTSKALGDIKLEHTIKRGIFLQPKLYFFDQFEYDYDDEGNLIYNFCACKGFTPRFKKKLTFETMEEALLTQDFSKLRERTVRPSSLKESSRRKIYGFTTLVQERSVQNPYDKRLVNPDYTTHPITMKDGISLYKRYDYEDETTEEDDD